jgi:hypothetical protein
MLKNFYLSLFTAVFILTAGTFCPIFSQEDAGETLQGDKAVNELKQTGHYDSLVEAVKQAREKQNEEIETLDEFAVGQTVKLTASNSAAEDRFGFSVAISGETAVIGAPNDDIEGKSNQGSAYVFVRSGTTWIYQAQLIASDGLAQDNFGLSVAVSGETIAVSARYDDIGVNEDRGSVYVFTRSGTAWTEQTQLLAADGTAGDQFGSSVALSGETIAVGTSADDINPNDDRGSVYVFTRSGTVWSQQAKFSAADGAAGDNFGNSIAIDADTIIVGAPLDDVGANSNQGSAYVFVRSGTVWTQQAQLFSVTGAADSFFGESVAISGDMVVLGEPFFSLGTNTREGAAHVYIRSGTIWSPQAQLLASDAAVSDQFGSSVAFSSSKIVVGAPFDDVGANSNQGSAYVFVRNGASWTQEQKITAADGAAEDFFGRSVAINGNNLIVGANLDDVGASINQGSAYLWRVLGSAWVQDAKRVAESGAVDDNFGWSVAVNGGTAVVGVPADDVGANLDQGSAYVFIRSGSTWTLQTQLFAQGGAAGDFFGEGVAVNGDTVIVGAKLDDISGNVDRGSAYIFVRNGTIWTQQAQLQATGGVANDNFGNSVSISGNTAVVGASNDDIGTNLNAGSVYVFTRSGVTWTQQSQITRGSAVGAEDFFGHSVSLSGNTLLVGANGDDVGDNIDQGSAYIYTRAGSSWSLQAQIVIADGATEDFFGSSVALDGDTAVIGANFDDVGANFDQGSAYVFTRNGTNWTQQAQLTAADGQEFDSFGSSVALNGNTIIVGAPFDLVGENFDQGSAYVFERTTTTWTQRAKLTDNSGAASDQFGFAVAVSGDKIVVGAPFSDSNVNTPLADAQVNAESLALASDQGAAIFFINNFLPPTSAAVTVGGRVFSPSGRGLSNAVVSLINDAGEMRSARTNIFGYYRFENVTAGQSVVISVFSKRHVFAPQALSVTGAVSDINFSPLQ